MRGALAAALLAIGCGVPVEGEPQVQRAAIIGGAFTTELPAVVLLVSYPADRQSFKTCTASVIAPKVLLTAAHCVDAQTHGGETFGVFTGADASAYGTAAQLIPQLVSVKAVHAHPDYLQAVPFTADIGVVELDAELLIAPLRVNTTTLTATVVGQTARIAGYGQLMYQQYNARRAVASTQVAALGQDTVQVGDTTHKSCIGDSGGPALVTLDGVEQVIAVDSYTDLSGCLEPAHYRRTDTYVDFLAQYVPSLKPPVDAGTATDGGAEPMMMEKKGCAAAPGLSAWLLGAVLLRAARRSARSSCRARSD